MYPNSDLSAGKLALVAIVAMVCLAIWITSVFVAARQPRRRAAATGTATLPQGAAETGEAQKKAA